MAKQRLYENITLTKSQAIKHPTKLSDKDRKEIAESVASHLADGGKVTKQLREKANSIVENNVSKNRWRFPISRYDFINENRRRYSKPLWERVIRDQRHIWEGCVGLADHPPQGEDPQFKHSAVIWNNLGLDETNNLVWADAVFVGEMGRLAEEILEADGKVGFSTAGLGDLQKVTEHVDGGMMEFYDVVPEEFIIERIADLVPNPSQDVYGLANMKVVEAGGQTNHNQLNEGVIRDFLRSKIGIPVTIKLFKTALQGKGISLSDEDAVRDFVVNQIKQSEDYQQEEEGSSRRKRMEQVGEIVTSVITGDMDMSEAKKQHKELLKQRKREDKGMEESSGRSASTSTLQSMRKGLLDGHTNPEEAYEALVTNYGYEASDAKDLVNRMAADTDFEPLSESYDDPGTAQKLRPADDVMEPSDPANHPPVDGNEADLPEDPHAGYEDPNVGTADPKVVWVGGDSSLQEKHITEEGDGGAGGDAGSAAGVTSEGFQSAAPENATQTTSPGQKKKKYTEPEEGKDGMKERVKPTLNSFEERRAYEDITRFIDSASQLESPHERLSEFKEIQTYLQDIDIPQLKEEVEGKIQETENEINQLVESGHEFKQIFGTDISAKDLRGALNNLSSVRKNLKESSYDWKKVALKTAEHLKRFVEAVQVLKNRPTIETHENLKKRNRQIQESLRDQMQNVRKKKDERIKQLENDLTKAHSALRTSIKDSKKRERALQKALMEEKKKTKELREKGRKIKENAETHIQEAMGEEQRYLFEGGRGAKTRGEEYRKQSRALTESANSKRISESKREVQEYFDSLLKKHGTAILPHSNEILEASNYQEAVNRYMKILDSRTQVDADTLLDMDNPMIYEAMMGDQ